MRRAGDVVFSDVNSGTGEGVVEFSNRSDNANVAYESMLCHGPFLLL